METNESTQAGERTQHTPGPWNVKLRSGQAGYREDGSHDVLLTVQIHAVGNGNQLDVIRKLQAAPEMFEALKAMLSAYSLGGRNAQEAKAAARAAIAKAEGRAQ